MISEELSKTKKPVEVIIYILMLCFNPHYALDVSIEPFQSKSTILL